MPERRTASTPDEFRKLRELSEAFDAWRKNHGVVWFDDDVCLAEAIAEVLGEEITWGKENVRVLGSEHVDE